VKKDIKSTEAINEILRPFANKAKIEINSIDGETDLLTLGILDSMDVLRVILELEQTFSVSIDLEQDENEELIISKQWFKNLVFKN
jgi:acyl carrier protein